MAASIVLLLPCTLAFASGGYFAMGRSAALVASFLALAICALFAPRPLPETTEGRTALAGLVALCVITASLVGMAPAVGPAFADFQRLLLYSVFLAASIAVFSLPSLKRLALPALLAGTLIVCAYALLGRFFPTIFEQTRSFTARGRLEQPISYWNALGIYAGMGIVLAAGLAGRLTRRHDLRAACFATVPWMAATVALTLSRGAIASTVIGLLVLAAVARTRAALTWCAATLGLAMIAGSVSLAFPSLRASFPEPGAAQPMGLVLFSILVLISLVAVVGAYALRTAEIPTGRRTGALVFALLVLALLALPLLTVRNQSDRGDPPGGRGGATADRLVSAQSSRLTYWEIALRGFVASPLVGEGPSSFRVRWLHERPFPEAASDAHSLYVETAGELGFAGLLALFTFLGGAIFGAARASRIAPALAATPVGVLGAFLVHAGLDWDWEVPTVAMTALVAVGLLVSCSGKDGPHV